MPDAQPLEKIISDSLQSGLTMTLIDESGELAFDRTKMQGRLE
jgi:hypothetical protein